MPLIILMAQKIRTNQQHLILNQSIKDSLAQPQDRLNDSVSNDFSSKPTALNSQRASTRYLRKFSVIQACSGACIAVALFFIFALPPIIQHLIVAGAEEQMTLSPQNENLWAHFPGDGQTAILRNFTFFKFENQGDFLFHNKKPIFREVSGFKIQQLEDYLDIQYLENGNKVKVRDWIRFAEWKESRNLDEQVSFLNMGGLGYWARLKIASPTLLLQQGLALLFTNLETSIIPTLIGSGISQQFLPNSSAMYSALLSPAGISRQNLDFIWSDLAYGLNSKDNVGYWAQSSIECYQNPSSNFIFSNGANLLKNYFAITDAQIKSLMEKFYNYAKGIRSLLLQNHYCADVKMEECTGRYLAVAQLADGWVTSHIPPVSSLVPTDTICTDNITCPNMFPQPYAFAKNRSYIDDKSPSFFTRDAVLGWFNYNNSIEEGIEYNTAQNCLLHIGNLDALWEMGMQFEKSKKPEDLEPIRTRFKLGTTLQAQAFWKWIYYFVNDFVLQNSNNQKTGIASLFTTGLYQQFSFLQDNLQTFLLTQMLLKNVSEVRCQQFFAKALDQDEKDQLIQDTCNAYNTKSEKTAKALVDICQNKYGAEWAKLKGMGVSLLGMQNFCDIEGGGVGGLLHEYKIELDKLYNCSQTPNPYCSNFQLAAIQWQNSTITLNPPVGLALSPVTSFSQWHKDAKAIQFQHFVRVFFDKEERDKFSRRSLEQLYRLLTFQAWFSTNLLVTNLKEGVINPYFMKYVRYVCIYVGLNGFSIERRARQFLFGYKDELIEAIRTKFPAFGGDPSVNSMVAFNDLNLTNEQATQTIVFKTGKDDFRNANQIYQTNGYKYLVNNYSSFNGNHTTWQWKTPWAQDDYFYGTTGKLFAPNQFQADNISILIPQLQRYAGISFKDEAVKIQRYGFDVYIAHPDSGLGSVDASTAKYYQTIPDVFNVTSIYGTPVYVTKNHFLSAEKWLERIVIYNQDKSIHYQNASEWDDSFVIVEPYTGVSFQSSIYLQNNYYHQQDQLFEFPIDLMLPIFSVSRGGNLTQSVFHKQYDALITALGAKQVVVYIGIGLCILSIGLLVFASLKKRKMDNRNLVSPQLQISLQEHQFDKPDSAHETIKDGAQ